MFTFVTIVFKKEIPLLLLQLKSIDKFAKNSGASKLIVIINDDINEFEKTILVCAATFIEMDCFSVEFIDYTQLIASQGLTIRKDWYTQQALKILVSNIVTDEYYLVLDAKTHLISELSKNNLFRNGKPIAHTEENYNLWGEYIINSAEAIDNKNINMKPFISPATPYMIITINARNLLKLIFDKTGNSIDQVISKNKKTTEFMLYYNYLVKSNLLDEYELTSKDRNWCTFFTNYPNKKLDIERIFNRIHSGRVDWLSIHRSRFQINNDESAIKERIIDVWSSKEIFMSKDAAYKFWNLMSAIQ